MNNNEISEGLLPLPAETPTEGLSFLENLAAGNIGAGIKMNIQGNTIPQIRTEYKRLIEKFEKDLILKKNQGTSAKELARWAVNERTKIAGIMRRKQGTSSKIILDLRDQLKYGLGGRTYNNLEQRALRSGMPQAQIPNKLLRNATKPNTAISNLAIKGASFLKHGGKAVIVISISFTAYTLLTAPEHKLEQIIYEELGGVAGGTLGGGSAVGLCILFGIATSGWGLLACGVVGGGLGGLAGSSVGNKVFLIKGQYIKDSKILSQGGFEEYDPTKFMQVAP